MPEPPWRQLALLQPTVRQDTHWVLIPDDLLHCGQGSDEEYVLALKISKTLGCEVEDLFKLPKN